MATPALCRAFSQNAWRRDLCSNCFRSKEEHKAAAAARQRSPSDAARIAATSIVKSILKGNVSANTNGIIKKSRSAVSFHKEEPQIIGYGGDDEIHSADEGEGVEEEEPPNEEEIEKEKAEQQALERLTKANTDFNSVIANLQLQVDKISQEKQIPSKGVPSGIPVPGGRSAYTGPLRLGMGSKDNDGNKKTLLVSVRPFGSSGEEKSKPPVKTKIAVSNGLGNGILVNGNSKEVKDTSNSTINGNITNGFGYSKEISVKVSVSSNGVETKSTIINNGSTWKSSTVTESNIPKVNGNLDIPEVKNKLLNGHSKQIDSKTVIENQNANPSSEFGGKMNESQPLSENCRNAVVHSKIGIPIPASRSIVSRENVNGVNQEKPLISEKQPNTPVISSANNSEEVSSLKFSSGKDESTISMEETLKSTPKEASAPLDISLNANAMVGKCSNNGIRNQHEPVPAERSIPCKQILASEKTSIAQSKVTHSEISKEQVEEGLVFKKTAETEEMVINTLKETKIISSCEENMTTDNTNAHHEGNLATKVSEPNVGDSNSSIPSLSQSVTSTKNKNSLTKQEHSKNSEEAAVKKISVMKASSNSTCAQKIPAVTKRPAPSILKMGVPTGWSSKSGSQKPISSNLAESGGKGSSEEKISCEKANIVNGILKTQPSTVPSLSPEKSSKPVNTIAKLRANFVNNNLKIIAESAAKIVNGTRYGNKNSLPDEIHTSKSSVMNLSMRPISTNNKAFANNDDDLLSQKGLLNLEKSSNSRAKGIGPDIRELLRTPDKERVDICCPNSDLNKKNIEESRIIPGEQRKSIETATKLDSNGENADDLISKIEGKSQYDTASADVTISQSESTQEGYSVKHVEESKEKVTEVVSSVKSDIPLKSCPILGENDDDVFKMKNIVCTDNVPDSINVSNQAEDRIVSAPLSERPVVVDSKPKVNEESPKKESPSKGESSPEKPSPHDKNRKKGIVRRMLLKGGNEIYRKAGEMVRSVRRSNEARDEMEACKENEIPKEERDLQNQVEVEEKNTHLKEIITDLQSELPACDKINEETTPSAEVLVEEAINPSVIIHSVEITPNGAKDVDDIIPVASSQIETIQSKETLLPEVKTVSASSDTEKPVSNIKPRPPVIGGTQPPVMSPRPSFLHGKLNSLQPWTSQSSSGGPPNDCNQPLSNSQVRSERALSMSALSGIKGPIPASGQRSRLASLPASDSESKTSAIPNPGQPVLRKPGPIISGVKPAIPAKPSKVLEASCARQAGTPQQHNKPSGERKGSTSMGTPGSVGRSAGKRQAPKPPGMDASQRRESSSSESSCNRENEQKIEGFIFHIPSGRYLEGSDASKSEENKAEVHPEIQQNREGHEAEIPKKVELKQEIDSVNKSAEELSANGESIEDIPQEDLTSPLKGTHFVKNQSLNASKSSSRVARETERRQMLLHMQSNLTRGPVPHPEGAPNSENSDAPDPLSSNSTAPLTARQRSASLGRGVGVASPRPPLPGGSLGRVAGEGAAFSIGASESKVTNPISCVTDHEKTSNTSDDSAIPHNKVSTLPYLVSDVENSSDKLRTDSPVRSSSEGSLAVHLAMSSNESRVMQAMTGMDTPSGKLMTVKGQDVMSESPTSVSASGKKKRHTVRGFLKFLRRGSLRDDACGIGGECRDDTFSESEPKARPVIVHPLELDGACVEVVKGGGVDVRRRLEEENAASSGVGSKMSESASGLSAHNEQNTPRRPTSIPLVPPRPPTLQSPSSPSLSSSSSSSCGSTPIRPRPPPPPRGVAPIPPSPGASGPKPARPPPPKPAHLLRLGLVDRGAPAGAAKCSGDSIYANLGEVRANLTPCKPQRTASMREVLPAASGKTPSDGPAPRVTPRNLQVSTNDAESAKNSSCPAIGILNLPNSASSLLNSSKIPRSDAEGIGASMSCKSEKLPLSIDAKTGTEVMTSGVLNGLLLCAPISPSVDSSSEDENVIAPPLPLAPPPSPPPPLPINPPPSPPSHPMSSSSSCSLVNPLVLPEDSGYESVEFHAVHDSDGSSGRWWGEGGIAASRVSVVTTATDSLEESYEAVVGANHRALADVLAQVCQPNPEELGAYSTLQWSDFLVEGPKGGVLRSLGPVTFHRAALKGKGVTGVGDSWRRVTLGVYPYKTTDLPQYFRGCACHENGNTPVGRCTPAVKSLCTFHDKVPSRFFSSDSDPSELVEAGVMVFNPLHLYPLKSYLTELMSEKKTVTRFPPLQEETNWANRACLFLLVVLDTLCAMCYSGEDDGLFVIREEAKPGSKTIEGEGDISESSQPICPLPRLCVIPNAHQSREEPHQTSITCFHGIVNQILGGIHGDLGMESFAYALQCVVGLQSSDDALVRSRAVLELWLFGPPLLHSVVPHVTEERIQDDFVEVRDTSRWVTKNILPHCETEPTSMEGELSRSAPRRWLDLERAGALRSLAVSALHRGGRIPSPVESGLDGSNGDEGLGLVGKCCRSWRVGEVAGNPTLPTCEEIRLRFLVGTCGAEVAEAWELLSRSDCSSPLPSSHMRTSVDASNKKHMSWNSANEQVRGEAHC